MKLIFYELFIYWFALCLYYVEIEIPLIYLMCFSIVEKRLC